MSTQVDPAITRTEVMYGEHAVIGSRVKHYGQRWTGCATATVTGFYHEPGAFFRGKPWVKVVLEHDQPGNGYDNRDWDWDRTELAPDIPL